MTKTIAIIILGAVAGLLALGAVGLLVCYQWIDYGSSAYLTRKTGRAAPLGQYAEPGQQGVQEQMLGPGRHFLNPWTYSLTRVKDIHVPAGYIGVVKSNVGKPLPAGRRLAEADEKGTRRALLTPGLWRINTFGMDVSEIISATIIKPGYVGVQTEQEGPHKGILPTVLQAGYYNINPLERKIHELEIGYRILEIAVKYAGADGKLIKGTGVSFPLADGNQMHLDMTVVWGIFPKDGPRIIREFGGVADVETKIIIPRVLSICKNAGSNLTTKEFIEGKMREEFQRKVTTSLQDIGKEKGIQFLIALVRDFHPDENIKATIQRTLLAEEEKTTLEVETKRDRVAAELEAAQRRVEIARKDFDAET
ncbi:MAG: hypothetical protein J7M14_05260, partial [Planctomycetes bacterium]|nr:hypothetical protein [Planctomycetota bacterium]